MGSDITQASAAAHALFSLEYDCGLCGVRDRVVARVFGTRLWAKCACAVVARNVGVEWTTKPANGRGWCGQGRMLNHGEANSGSLVLAYPRKLAAGRSTRMNPTPTEPKVLKGSQWRGPSFVTGNFVKGNFANCL